MTAAIQKSQFVCNGQPGEAFLKPEDVSIQTTAQKILQTFETGRAFRNTSEWKRTISNFSACELKRVLNLVMEEMDRFDQPILSMESLARILPLDLLQKAVQIDHPSHVDALQTAKEMSLKAQHVLRIMDGPPTLALRRRISSMIDSLISGFESILSGFGIAEFFKPSDSPTMASFKNQQIMVLLHLSAMLAPILGSIIGAAAIGWTLLFIAAASLVYPYVRAVPSHLPKGVNWTRQYNQGRLAVSQGRQKILNELAHTLLSSTKVKTHPLLIGQSGVGKTEAVKAFVQAIERGDYPELKGKQVFYFNTADLVGSREQFQNENRILFNINEEIGRNRNNMILVFDEIHLACQKDQLAFGEQLKTLLDPGSANLPYVIGITTEEEYGRDIHVNKAFARRFKCINIENTDASETLTILTNAFLQQAPELILERGVLQSIHEKTKAAFPENVPEPITSLKILSRCIQKTADSQRSPLEEKVEQARSQLQSLLAEAGAGQGNSLLPYQNRKGIQTLQSNLQKLEKELRKEQEKLIQFFQLREKMVNSKMNIFKTVVKMANLQPGKLSTSDRHSLSLLLLLSHFLAPAQERFVRERAASLGIRTEINSGLVDQVIQDELNYVSIPQ